MSAISQDDDRLFLDDEPGIQVTLPTAQSTLENTQDWMVLVVDDEEQVHSVTHLVLGNFQFENQKIKIIDAYSGIEALEVLTKQPKIALILLDVVMESETAGLDVARKIREELKNQNVRIVLRTGQPGQAPEQDVIVNYDINDYKDKTELTAQKLHTLTYSNLRSFRDILQVEQTKVALEEGKKHIFNIINSMPSALIGVTEALQVTDWNLEATKLTGLSFEATRQQPLFHLVPSLNAIKDLVDQTITHHETRHLPDIVLPLNPAQIRHYSITTYPLKIGDLKGAVIRFDDITSQLELEKMMMQSEKMMTIGGLAAGMAHEIKNPLGGIVQNLQNVLKRLEPDFDKNQIAAAECQLDLKLMREYLEKRSILKYLDAIRLSVDRALSIITKMLRFGRNDQSELIPVALPDLVEEALGFVANDYELKKTYDFKKTNLIRKFDPDLPLVPCARTELVQVLLNLLKNAGQAMPTEQKNPQIIVHLKQQPDRVQIIIEDNGSGIDEKVRSNLFKPFFTTKKVGIGTGLGLSVCRFIITELHHGLIDVTSEPAKGTKFIIELPKDSEHPLSDSPSPTSSI